MPPADDAHGVTVRRAGVGDAVAVARLLGVLGYPDEVEVVAARLRQFATSDRDAVLVAEDGGRVVGVVALSLTPLLAGGGWWSRITALAVDPRLRRRGVAAALVAEAERAATDGGSRLMQLNCGRRPERAAAHEFYPALGYRDQYDHHVLYEKRLDGPAG